MQRLMASTQNIRSEREDFLGPDLALDQGNDQFRAIVFDDAGAIIASCAEGIHQTSRPGWVEHDPSEIWETGSRRRRCHKEAS